MNCVKEFITAFIVLIDLVRGMGLSAPCEIRMAGREEDFTCYKSYGYNVASLGNLGLLGTYDEIVPGAISEGSPLRKQIKRKWMKFSQQCADAKNAAIWTHSHLAHVGPWQ